MSDQHMHDADTTLQRLRETAWRRPLTSEEQQQLRLWLEAHPGDQPDWALEEALSRGLRSLPDVPVPSNFTARILEEVQRAPQPAEWSRPRLWVWRWLPRVAFAAVLLSAGVVSVHQYRRHQLADSLSAISSVGSIPSPQVLEDFDAIRALNQNPAPDEELLALLK